MNKQYLLLGGMPILARTALVFQQASFVHDIHLVIPRDEIDFCLTDIVEKYRLDKVTRIIPGGSERQHSVANGLREMEDPHPDDVILIHDGVRPFVTADILAAAAEAAAVADGALVAVQSKDTVKLVSDGFVRETPSREGVWLAQTPQAFRYALIREAHEAAEAEGFLGTDDTSLIERRGGKIRVVPGSYRNIKMTTPEDLLIGEAFLAAGER